MYRNELYSCISFEVGCYCKSGESSYAELNYSDNYPVNRLIMVY